MEKTDKKGLIRKDVTNKKLWVFEVYYDGRSYPNIISARYKSKRNVQQALYDYLMGGSLDCYPESKGL